MTTDEYLARVLAAQTLAPDGKELKELRARREAVESLLRDAFGNSPHIRYGGSKAKGTMILESYDLDIPFYVERDDAVAGETLKEIYDNVATALERVYFVERKRSALRLTSKQTETRGEYLHVDVVPGRFIVGDSGDVFLYQNGGDKDCLKTNLDVHIAHISGSCVTDAIRLLKLWKVRNDLQVKTFVLELLVVDILKNSRKKGLGEQLAIVLMAFRDLMGSLSVDDPANPYGNDLSDLLDAARFELSATASSTLQTVEDAGWEQVFGPVESDADKRNRLQGIAITVPSSQRTQPWSSEK